MSKLFSGHRLVALALFSALLLVLAVSASFSWFAENPLTPVGGEVVPGYFAGGDGTAANPYVIKRPIHLYNLAWLQNIGRFNQKDANGNYTQYHFVLSDNLDMKGYTLPPIGTAEYPFIGTFESETNPLDGTVDEVCYTISNLTVSNTLAVGEIERRPPWVTELSGAEVIGMFGVIGVYDLTETPVTYGSIVPSVSDYYLKDPVVRAQTPQALMGLIAGYVNGKLHNVGVVGGILESGLGHNDELSGDSISYYGLIGNRAASVNWGGITAPGAGSGAIKIDPNDTDLQAAITTSEYATQGYIPVPEAATDRAFIASGWTDATTKEDLLVELSSGGTPNIFHMYKTLITCASDGTSAMYTTPNGTREKLDSSLAKDGYLATINPAFKDNADFYKRLTDKGTYQINTGTYTQTVLNDAQTAFRRTITVTLKDESLPANQRSLTIPAGGIWFKPASDGNCIISFLVSNMSGNAYKSLYRYKRDANGNIDNSTISETVFQFTKKNSDLKNGDVVCFSVNITAAEVLAGYEYLVGNTSHYPSDEDKVNDSCNFYFLALAGASTKGSVVTSQSKELLHINFIDEATREAGGDVADNGMKVNTFDIRLLATGAAFESVIFARTNMTADTTATITEGQLSITRYSHTAIVLDQTTPTQ